VLVREATADELALAQAALKRQRGLFANAPDAAKKLISVGEWPGEATLDPAEHAAWTQVCLMLLNLDETLSKP
jgi:hypothetical protein